MLKFIEISIESMNMELVCSNVIFGMFPFAGYSNAMQDEQFNLEKSFIMLNQRRNERN